MRNPARRVETRLHPDKNESEPCRLRNGRLRLEIELVEMLVHRSLGERYDFRLQTSEWAQQITILRDVI